MKKTVIVFAFGIAAMLPSSSLAFETPSNASAFASNDRIFDEFDTLITTAYTLYTQKKYDEALAKCAEAARLRPGDNRPYAIAGLVYMAQWKMKSASESFAKAISLSPRNEKLHYIKARSDRFRNAREEGLVSVRKAIELNPEFAEAYLLLGELLSIGGGNHKERIEAFRKAIELKPDMLEAYRELGMALDGGDDEKGAEEIYRKAMAIDPKKMAGRFELGRLLVGQGRLKEARELWEGRSSDVDKTFPNFITLLERAERVERARIELAARPNDPEALLQMGLMVMDGDSWVMDGRQERAIDYFRKALAIRPDLARAQFAIVRAYIEMAGIAEDKNEKVDEELAKLRKMDAKLAQEAVKLRTNYKGALITGPPAVDQ